MFPRMLYRPAGLRQSRSSWLGILVAILVACAPAWGGTPGEGPPPWSYSGASGSEHWGELSPAYAACAEGERQSPIDIRSAQRMPYVPLMFQYRSHPLEASNDGRGVHVQAPPGSELRIRGDAYQLVGLHFHVPGEHRIDGVGSAAEIHLEHRGPAGETVMVAVPVRAGRRVNSILKRIVEHLPMRPGERVEARRIGINPLFLLPTRRDYFVYDGSLDVPPCTEPVRWFVMAHPLEVDASQIQQLARATGSNAREVQPADGRTVFLAVRGR